MDIRRILRESINKVLLEDSDKTPLQSDIEAAQWFKENYPEYADYDNPRQEGAFILTNGKVIYMSEHYYILSSTNIMDLGAIRLSNDGHAVELHVEPTPQQYAVMDRVISSFIRTHYALEIKRHPKNGAMLDLYRAMRDAYYRWLEGNRAIPYKYKMVLTPRLTAEYEKLDERYHNLNKSQNTIFYSHVPSGSRNGCVSQVIRESFKLYHQIEAHADYYIANIQAQNAEMDKFFQEAKECISKQIQYGVDEESFRAYVANKINERVIPVVRRNFDFEGLPAYDNGIPIDVQAEIMIALSDSIHGMIDYVVPRNSLLDVAEMIYDSFTNEIVGKAMDGDNAIRYYGGFPKGVRVFSNLEVYKIIFKACLGDDTRAIMMKKIMNILKAMR